MASTRRLLALELSTPDYSDTEAEQLKDRLLYSGFGHFPTKRLKDRVPAAVGVGGAPQALDWGFSEGLIAERAPWFTGSIEIVSTGKPSCALRSVWRAVLAMAGSR